jgi:predicted nucleic acid-binding protein
MRIALDSGSYTALAAGEAALADRVRHAELVGLPSVVLGELWLSFMGEPGLARRRDSLERFLAIPRVRVLSPGERTARLFAEIATLLACAGAAMTQNEMWTAALCREHEFVLASRAEGYGQLPGLETV